jgi:hypothetical protein
MFHPPELGASVQHGGVDWVQVGNSEPTLPFAHALSDAIDHASHRSFAEGMVHVDNRRVVERVRFCRQRNEAYIARRNAALLKHASRLRCQPFIDLHPNRALGAEPTGEKNRATKTRSEIDEHIIGA